MPRPLLVLIVFLLIVAGLITWLATVDTEVPVTRISVPVAPNAAPAK